MNATCLSPTPCNDSHSFPLFVATLFLSAVALATIVGNVLAITAILTNRKLQTLSNIIIFSLSITDFLVGLLVMPWRIIEDIYHPVKWEFGGPLCSLAVFLMVSTYLASMLPIFAISVDRFLVVTCFEYKQRRSKKHMLAIVTFAWGIALIITGLPLMGLRDDALFEEYIAQGRCKYEAGYIWYFPILYWSCFLAPLTIIIPLHVAIYRKAKKSVTLKVKEDSSASRTPATNQSTVTRTSNCDLPAECRQMACADAPTGGSSGHEVRSEPKRPADAREARVARILTVVTTAYIICVTPQVVYNSILRILSKKYNLPLLRGPLWMNDLFLWLVLCNSLVNPIIYTRFNREFVVTFYRIKEKLLSLTLNKI